MAAFLALQCLVAVILFYPTINIAKDLGIVGQTFPIAEKDMIEDIQSKLKSLDKSGELQKHQEHLMKSAFAAIMRPKPVEGITKTTETKTFYYDPSFSYPFDLKDHQGKVFYKAGTRLNPLSYQTYSHEMILIDSDDEEQKTWCLNYIQNFKTHEHVKVVLIKGAPLQLTEEWERPIYFDQGGVITKRLNIRHVPALITQDGMELKIMEIKIERENHEEETE